MFSVSVKSSLFIAHSLEDPSFGPAQNLHGATLDVTVTVFREKLTDLGIVIDIGYLSEVLDGLVEKYNYANLDDLEEFDGKITSIDFLCGYFFKRIATTMREDGIDLGPNGISKLKIRIDESSTAWATYVEKVI